MRLRFNTRPTFRHRKVNCSSFNVLVCAQKDNLANPSSLRKRNQDRDGVWIIHLYISIDFYDLISPFSP